MIYVIDDQKFSTPNDAAEYITDNIDDDYFDEVIDECEPDGVKICGLQYSASHALKTVDPVAYRCSKLGWLDVIRQDIAHDLDGMMDGDASGFFGFEVAVEWDGEEEDEDVV